MIDNGFFFAKQQSLSGTSDAASTNIHEEVDPDTGAGAATLLFKGQHLEGFLVVVVTAFGAAGGTPTFRARFVSATDAVLTGTPEILCDTGVVADPTSITPLAFLLVPKIQINAKRYYGFMFTLAGTTPTATVNAYFTLSPPSMAWRKVY